MPVTTLSAAVYITPTVIRTFLEHARRKAERKREGVSAEDGDAKADDIFFDEAFNIVKAFIQLGTENTVESLQAFTNTHVPSPYWAAVSPVTVPHSSCNLAADKLIEWFGPQDLADVVGGERWWQVRGLDGVDAEWICQKEFLDDAVEDSPEKKLSQEDTNILRMEKLKTVMFYIHGGGYFWGSINTHRYQIIRYARKFKGRAFAVNYRKAPQYPWPCALHDVLAAYLYLIDPPPNAVHKAVSPNNIIFAGDSAGGGLAVAVMTILRDLSIPLPAGAVLISPWVDLTHSFPSVMQNVETDIIPQHGFLAKPSTLWPVTPVPLKVGPKLKDGTGTGRAAPTSDPPPPVPGHADNLSRPEAKRKDSGSLNDQSEPKPPKVLMDDPSAEPLELRAQIQLYATTEQLSHPLVSPILQGSLGGLPPLFIIAGNDEVLRDEVIYLAHKAAHPADYPARAGVLREAHRQRENFQKFTTPTKVHLQVFDGMCHVLTVFSFTESAKIAYRQIAAFCTHVATHSEEYLEKNPFPVTDLYRSPSMVPSEQSEEPRRSVFRLTKKTNEQGPGFKMPFPAETNNATMDLNDPEMIRERVDIHGKKRPMESSTSIACLQLRPAEIGLIKEAPTVRWLRGQDEWDRKYRRSALRAVEKRKKIEAKTNKLLEHAKQQGLSFASDGASSTAEQTTSDRKRKTDGVIQTDRRWGPLDLDKEHPPPSAIAKRRDTPEALALLRKTIYFTAPSTHHTVPRMKVMDAIGASFDPHDDPLHPPKQSEEQVRTHIIPMHGLRIWDALVTYFMRKSSIKASADVKYATSTKEVVNSSG